ncbi:MAG: hypothetical protein P8127_13435, partial [Acidobacteriota bacterium]
MKISQQLCSIHEFGDGTVTFSDFLEVVARSHQPVTEQPRTHPGLGMVEDIDQRSLARSVGRALNLQVAKAG